MSTKLMSYCANPQPVELVVHRASGIGELHAPMLVIRAEQELPSPRYDSEEESTAHLERIKHEGDSIARALSGSLPGGVIDALLRRLLEYRASQLAVVSSINEMFERAAGHELLLVARTVQEQVERGEPCPCCSCAPHIPGCALVHALAKAEGR